MSGITLAFIVLSTFVIVSGWLVFRFNSMVRATYALLLSFLATSGLFLLLDSEFLFAISFLMMVGEMVIMVMFMIAFMMNPAGLNPMNMVHQPRIAAFAGFGVFALLTVAILTADFPQPIATAPADVTAAIGFELLGSSMLIFETAGVTLLAGMIAVIALAARRGRFNDAVLLPGKRSMPNHGGHGGMNHGKAAAHPQDHQDSHATHSAQAKPGGEHGH
ncbi:NADH-quinone oxidoreductase subunit J [Thermithiobacillus plumbiphilus]|uniref:NADH-quinone oxidoreductase subunit J n=1 Tax=Thermithiobacillus plumbiphilus TaxID=1729899 RepID=A0ABU9D6F1_9PROT